MRYNHFALSPAVVAESLGMSRRRDPNPTLEDFPENVISDILLRLPVNTITHCKCVCKKWRNIVSDSYFAHIHLSKKSSPGGLIIHHLSHKDVMNFPLKPGFLNFVEIQDQLDNNNRLLKDPIISIDLDAPYIFQNTTKALVG